MGKTRTGCIRIRPKRFFASVTYTAASGKQEKREQRARSRTHAKHLSQQMVRSLRREGITVITGQRVREQPGGIFARVTYTDEKGRRREQEKRADTRTHAKHLIKQMLRELDDYGSSALDSSRRTFQDLADYFERTYLTEAQYRNDRKVSGLRDLYHAQMFLRILRAFFGKMKLRSITHGDIERFKNERLNTPTYAGFLARVTYIGRGGRRVEKKQNSKSQARAEAFIEQQLEQLSQRKGVSAIESSVEEKKGGERAIASVNRELALLGRMLRIAHQEDWLLKNPFTRGDALLKVAHERKRERILSRAEEERLLAACDGPRAHLRPILICAIDTGMRRGEIFKLRWADVDFAENLITIRAFNTKTMRERQVALTERLAHLLRKLYEKSPQDPDGRCFGINDNVKSAFTKARRDAGLMDVRFHDLRHTHASRLVAQQISLTEVGRVLGHTQPATTYRYANVNIETARRVASALDEFNRSVDGTERPAIN